MEVYKTHARMALEAGDFLEHNQCQTQLKDLYGEGIQGCSNEFATYNLMYILFNHGNNKDLLSTIARLVFDGRRDEVVKHALAMWHALAVGNYRSFFRLYMRALVLSPCLVDIYMEKMQFETMKCMTLLYRPMIPMALVAEALEFSMEARSEEKAEGEEKCEEWLSVRVQFDSNSNELVVEAKLSSTSLFMSQPEDVVPYKDANLALNEFFLRS